MAFVTPEIFESCLSSDNKTGPTKAFNKLFSVLETIHNDLIFIHNFLAY